MLLIVDIESYIYKACTACIVLRQHEKEPYIYYEAYDVRKGLDYIDTFIEDLKAKFLTNDVELVVGDKNNWRKDYCITYKANRKDTPKPIMYQTILKALYERYSITSLPNLEADDTCRIMFEDNNNYPVRKVLVSIDKDFRSFPCELYDPLHDKHEVINQQNADYNLMKQLIMGDKADNYKGVEGYGEIKTNKFLSSEPRTFEDVKALFKEAGQVQDYFTNLNLASIVSLDRYNFETGEVKIIR